MTATRKHEFDHRILRDHAFALVAPTALEGLPSEIEVIPLVPRGLDASVHLMPRLIDLRALATDVADVLLNQLQDAYATQTPPSVCVLIDTDTDVADFARHWNASQLVSPGPGLTSWLRLHDPRVLHQLLRMLTTSERAALFGRARAMTYWLGGLWVSARANDGKAAEPRPPSGGRAQWNWGRIERIGIINRALQDAGIAGKDMHRQGAVVEELITHAGQRYGLASTDDLVEFAVRGLTTSLDFDTHPQIAPAIMPDADPDDDSRLADRLALIDDDVWHALQRTAPDYKVD
jgi:hypothetical protein